MHYHLDLVSHPGLEATGPVAIRWRSDMHEEWWVER